jgi:ParB-like chromosome segregation protein Spo0J
MKKPQRKQEPAETVKVWPLDEIVPYERNPRTHPDAQIEMLARLMQEHGVDQPIVVDEHGVIIKGHGRLMAAKLAGMDSFPVVVKRGLSEDQKRAERMADNQVALLAGWDKELVRLEMGELKLAGYDLPLLGFDDQQLVAFMARPTAPGEFPEMGEGIETEHACPKCGYRWSGNPMAGEGKGG